MDLVKKMLDIIYIMVIKSKSQVGYFLSSFSLSFSLGPLAQLKKIWMSRLTSIFLYIIICMSKNDNRPSGREPYKQKGI